MRILSLVVLASLLITPAMAQDAPKRASERSKKRRAKRGKFDFKEQTYKLPKLLQLMGELTRKNFIVSKELKNKEITIYCQSPVSISEAYRVFVSALSAHKMSLVKVGRFYRVVKAKDAVKGHPKAQSILRYSFIHQQQSNFRCCSRHEEMLEQLDEE